MDLLEGLWGCWALSSFFCFNLLAHCSSWQRREGILALLALHIPEELASSLFLAPCRGRKHKQRGQRGSVLGRVARWNKIKGDPQLFRTGLVFGSGFLKPLRCFTPFWPSWCPPTWESQTGVFPLIKLSRKRGPSSLGKVESPLLSNSSQISLSTHQASTMCSVCCCESLIFSHFGRRKGCSFSHLPCS